MSTKVIVNFVDVTGQIAVETFFSSANLAANSQAGLVTALSGISDAGITGMKFTHEDVTVSGTVSDGVYATPEDKAMLFFRSIGGQYQIALPAPDSGDFLSDKETVDPVAVGDFITLIETNGADPNGNALSYSSGQRMKTSTKSGNRTVPPSGS